MTSQYSSPLLQWTSGLIRGVVSPEGYNLVLFTISLHFISGLIRGVTFGGSGLIRGGQLYLEINKKKLYRSQNKYILENILWYTWLVAQSWSVINHHNYCIHFVIDMIVDQSWFVINHNNQCIHFVS